MKKNRVLFSFCVYGNNPKYTNGLINNIDFLLSRGYLIQVSYSNISEDFLNKLLQYNIIINEYEYKGGSEGMLYRIFNLINKELDFFFIRDADSLISEYELDCCHEFMISGKDLHIIRNHPLHNMPIMGGLFGGNAKVLHILRSPFFQFLFRLYIKKSVYQSDQKFLIALYAACDSKYIHSSHNFFLFEEINLINFNPIDYFGKDKTSLSKITYNNKFKFIIIGVIIFIKIYTWALINKVLHLLKLQKNY